MAARESSDASIHEFLRALADSDAAHAGVSAAAVAGALGTSLLQRVATLPMTRSDSAADRVALVQASKSLHRIQEQLLATIETETVVRIYAARSMPRRSVAERAERDAAMQLALRAAADVPLEVLRLCVLGLKQSARVAEHSARAAANELKLGVTLLRDAFGGAQSNVEARLTSLTDPVYVQTIADQIARLNAEAFDAVAAAERIIPPQPA